MDYHFVFMFLNNLAKPGVDRVNPRAWTEELRASYTDVASLLKHHLISAPEAEELKAIGDRFKVRITPYYAGLMSEDKNCPIRLQAIPHLLEADPELPDWAVQLSQAIYKRPTPWDADPIGDVKNLSAPRITHRYRNRAIIHISSMCAVYCRFCFRKSHLNEVENTLYAGSLEPAFDYVQKNEGIRELIFTGGDPLSLSDAVLRKVLIRVSQIPHIRSVRFHSRMAVTLPSRFTPSLLELLGENWNFNVAVVSHFNHPKEITFESRNALKGLQKAGITLLNQSVLLKGINDSAECLSELFQELYESGTIPFYLHHPDWTPGTFHFRTSIEKGQEILKQLRGTLPGPALPHYVLDIPQGFGKTSLEVGKVRLVRSLGESRDRVKGAIFEVSVPTTKTETYEKMLYLDLFT